jgi:hypothetical protein
MGFQQAFTGSNGSREKRKYRVVTNSSGYTSDKNK